MSLYEKEGRRQDRLALSRGFDKTMIAKSVVRPEDESSVRREIDQDDKRVKRLYLTKNLTPRPEMERTGYRLNTLLMRDCNCDESATAMSNLRKIALNASEL
ncbi:hypothetical protein [uncultured Methanoregula sp.]|uniref:hypothetical protein n=1 Tax=uncultured Methanoregula sp. TaxID=1005933 RepID=UPI002AAB436A|nr:hypothetical protein [uncultured Methanoregula sp.]